ncbi:OmpP1/FadL family transporter [Roseovarius sp. S4756]|uniref:OmpP1/FadL family transporter n=1 Tax=Roseovarius maritimus TaxID=3342637 RepID=UPI00372A1CB2
MKFICFSLGASLSLIATAVTAGNLDRTRTPIDIIFEEGNYVELSFGYLEPSVTGRDAAGNATGGVSNDFQVTSVSGKLQFTNDISVSAIYDQPYGTDNVYGGDPVTTLLGGTIAQAETEALTLLLAYDATDSITVFGGPRIAGAQGRIALSGLAYGPLNGYSVRFANDQGTGYVIGAAYQIPEIAFRTAVTYHSGIDVDMRATETFPGGVPVVTGSTRTTLPQSLKLQIQSGIAANTIAFGSIRWSDWSVFSLEPPSPAPELADIDDAWTYELGVGYRFTDKFSASVTYVYEQEEGDNLVTPLAPTRGYQSVSLGGKYQLSDAVSFSSGIQYIWIDNALLETFPPNVVRGNFRDNDAVAIGFKLGVSF